MSVVRRAMAIASKEVTHIARDPQLIGFALGMPVVLLLLFGYAVSFDIEHIPLAVVDEDRTADSRAVAERFTSSEVFVKAAEATDTESVEPLFRRSLAKAALVFPEGFARAMARGDVAHAQLLLDGSDNTTAATALGYASTIALGAAARAAGVEPAVELEARTFFNPRLKSSVFLVPGLMALILVMVAVMLTALAVAREYERGSMEQLFATPVGRLEIILGKLGPNFVLGLLQVLLVLVVGVTLFEVPIRGSLLLVFLVSALFLLAMLMLGLVISVKTKSQMVASQIAAISTLLPSMLLSGFVFPVENLPLVLKFIASILPARYFIDALRAILLRGNGLDVVWPDLLALLAFFLVMLVVATRSFQRRLA